MGVVLLESSDPGKARESAVNFVSVQHSKISVSDGEVSPGPESGVEHETVSWAVHGLEPELSVLEVDDEHVFLVLFPVSGDYPELTIVHIGTDDLRVAPNKVLLA